MQIEIDSRNNNTVYTGFQFGNYFRLNLETNQQTYIQPKHELGENPYRFNWQTPILLSPHNQDILYLGGNKLMRSMNQGNDWEATSEDLTNGGKKGDVSYGTLTSISESPFQFGLIYTGSDDGLVHITKDAGTSWKSISNSFPKDLWVSRVIASKHNKQRVYVTLNGYRWDDFNTYVYMSNDFGDNWEDISSNIPKSPVNVIKEDTENENVLYLGTDNGAYVSFNQGENWEAFSKNLPNVAVHDIVIQPEEKDLLLGTHGRSIYKTNISPLQQMSNDMKSESVTIFDIDDVRFSSQWGSSWSQWTDSYEPEIDISFYSNSSDKKSLEVFSDEGNLLNQMDVDADKGFNYASYDLTLNNKGRKALLKEKSDLEIDEAKNGKYYLPKGKYIIKIDGASSEFEIK